MHLPIDFPVVGLLKSTNHIKVNTSSITFTTSHTILKTEYPEENTSKDHYYFHFLITIMSWRTDFSSKILLNINISAKASISWS
jgi:hypothetical protein